MIIKKSDGRYYKKCPNCNKEQSYLRRNYALQSLKLKLFCKSCSNKITINCHRGWHRSIRLSWYEKFKTSATTRGIDWNIDIDDVADLYLLQDKKCALTGISLEFPESGHPQNCLASIDRIVNSKPYNIENIQIVLKEVNMMKGKYTQEEFIKICLSVSEHVNKQSKVVK